MRMPQCLPSWGRIHIAELHYVQVNSMTLIRTMTSISGIYTRDNQLKFSVLSSSSYVLLFPVQISSSRTLSSSKSDMVDCCMHFVGLKGYYHLSYRLTF